MCCAGRAIADHGLRCRLKHGLAEQHRNAALKRRIFRGWADDVAFMKKHRHVCVRMALAMSVGMVSCLLRY